MESLLNRFSSAGYHRNSSVDSISQEIPGINQCLKLEERVKQLFDTLGPFMYVLNRIKSAYGINEKLIEPYSQYMKEASLFLEKREEEHPAKGIDYTEIVKYYDLADIKERVCNSCDEFDKILKDQRLSKKENPDFIKAIKSAFKAGDAFKKNFCSDKVDPDQSIIQIEEIRRSHIESILRINSIQSSIDKLGNFPFKEAKNKLDQLMLDIQVTKGRWNQYGVDSTTLQSLFQGLDERVDVCSLYYKILNASELTVSIKGRMRDLEILSLDPDSDLEYLMIRLKGFKFNPKAKDSSDELKSLDVVIKSFERLSDTKSNAGQEARVLLEQVNALVALQKEYEVSIKNNNLAEENIGISLPSFLSGPKIIQENERLVQNLNELEELSSDVKMMSSSIDRFHKCVLDLFTYLKNGQALRHARKYEARLSIHKREYESAAEFDFKEFERFYKESQDFILTEQNNLSRFNQKQKEILSTLESLLTVLWNDSEESRKQSKDEMIQTGGLVKQSNLNDTIDFRKQFPGPLGRAFGTVLSAVGIN